MSEINPTLINGQLADALIDEAQEALNAAEAERQRVYSEHKARPSAASRRGLAETVKQETEARAHFEVMVMLHGPNGTDPDARQMAKLLRLTPQGQVAAVLLDPPSLATLLNIPPCRLSMNLRTGEIYAGHTRVNPRALAVTAKQRAGMLFAVEVAEKGKGSGVKLVVPDFGKETFIDGIEDAARKNGFDPVVQYLESLEWDGKDRFFDFVEALHVDIKTHGLKDYEIHREMLLRTMIGAVARAYEPGCKMDTVLILHEPTGGAGKSRMWEALFGRELFSDTPLEMDSKDRFLPLRMCWGIEFGELAAMKRADMREDVKAFLSSGTDRYREPYAREAEAHGRRCVFVGTTNGLDWLQHDEGGNRRFWVIRDVGAIDVAWVRENRDQLWAQAFNGYREGADWWFETGSPEAEAIERANSDRSEDDRLPLVSRYLAEKDLAGKTREYVTTADVARGALGLSADRVDHKNSRLIGSLMRAVGWGLKDRRVDGRVVKVWTAA